MDIHKNARTTPHSRAAIVERVIRRHERVGTVAAAMGVCPKTVRKWVARAQAGAGLTDRSSRPQRVPTATPAALIAQIAQLRRQRWTGAEIAARRRIGRSTVARLLARQGLARLRALEPVAPVQRYERAHPGELLHVDVKKLGRIGQVGHRVTGNRAARVRGIGWEYVHVAVDDASRVAYAEVLPDERGSTVTAFLWRALTWYRRQGIRIQRVMTDNAFAYLGHAFTALCARRGLHHLRTRPYTPRTNGKVERLIQTLLREWAYVRPYRSSHRRQQVLPRWLHFYNWHRPHTSLAGRPPISRLLPGDNLVRLHS